MRKYGSGDGQVSRGFWVRGALLVAVASLVAPALALVTLWYMMFLGWPPLVLLFGALIGRSQHGAAGLPGPRVRWMVATAGLQLLGTVAGAAILFQFQDPVLTSPAFAWVVVGAVAAVLGGQALLLRRVRLRLAR